jgi:hypothetical protein
MEYPSLFTGQSGPGQAFTGEAQISLQEVRNNIVETIVYLHHSGSQHIAKRVGF